MVTLWRWLIKCIKRCWGNKTQAKHCVFKKCCIKNKHTNPRPIPKQSKNLKNIKLSWTRELQPGKRVLLDFYMTNVFEISFRIKKCVKQTLAENLMPGTTYSSTMFFSVTYFFHDVEYTFNIVLIKLTNKQLKHEHMYF